MGLLMKQNLDMQGTKKTAKTKCVIQVLPKSGAGTAKCRTRKAKVKTGGG